MPTILDYIRSGDWLGALKWLSGHKPYALYLRRRGELEPIVEDLVALARLKGASYQQIMAALDDLTRYVNITRIQELAMNPERVLAPHVYELLVHVQRLDLRPEQLPPIVNLALQEDRRMARALVAYYISRWLTVHGFDPTLTALAKMAGLSNLATILEGIAQAEKQAIAQLAKKAYTERLKLAQQLMSIMDEIREKTGEYMQALKKYDIERLANLLDEIAKLEEQAKTLAKKLNLRLDFKEFNKALVEDAAAATAVRLLAEKKPTRELLTSAAKIEQYALRLGLRNLADLLALMLTGQKMSKQDILCIVRLATGG